MLTSISCCLLCSPVMSGAEYHPPAHQPMRPPPPPPQDSTLLARFISKDLLQARLAQLQADRDQLDNRATVAERDYAAASSELEETKLNLNVKLEEQQNQFRAIEEEQYSDWEKRVNLSNPPTWLLSWTPDLS